MEGKGKINTSVVKKVALLGTYVPRQCGIATFTKDMRDALVAAIGPGGATVLAMDEESSNLRYPADVRFQVGAHRHGDYRVAADLLNINQVDATIVQHEFGIYGGPDGNLVLSLLRRLRMPVISTLHTVLKEPTKGQKAVIRELAELSDTLVVMSEMGAAFLDETYKVPRRKIVMIPHGIPDVSFVDPSFYKDQFGLQGRTTLLTFGLLSPGKGIDVMLDALPKVLSRHPDVVYVILGAAHPHVLRVEGNSYHNGLEQKVDRLGLREHVVFQNRFVTLEELCGYIGAADLYVTPYRNEAQITSGALAYAMGAGKAVVSTPYWYAQEMLADGRGRLFPFGDSDALAEQVNDLLDHPIERDHMRKRAYLHCRPMVWGEVARRYLEVAYEAIEERRLNPRTIVAVSTDVVASDSIPDIDLSHLRTLTDGTGIFQHAIYTIPNRNHGYCIDDNARALIALLRYHALRLDASALPLISTYLSFVHGAFNTENGRFRNFMSFSRVWLDETGSEDAHGRALWSLGEAVALAPNDGMQGLSTRLFEEALRPIEEFSAPRAWAFALLGIHAYLRRYSGDTHVRRVRRVLARRLFQLFEKKAVDEWPWCEDIVTYDNGKLPHALLLSGRWLPDSRMQALGLRVLEWLLKIQTNDEGHISLIGCNGWYVRGNTKALFDQQPIEIMSLVDACAEAYRQTGEDKWLAEIRRCLDWFLGKNDLGTALYDFKTGGCRDGLNPQGANQNEGAESTISWLIAVITSREIVHRQDPAEAEPKESAPK